MAEHRILLTGFEPFGDDATNSSWDAVRNAAEIDSSVVLRRLPVTFAGAHRELFSAIDEVEPDIVVTTGQASGRHALTVERAALNFAAAPIADNAGHQPTAETLEGHAPAAYFTTLPLDACIVASRRSGVPAAASNSAGTYVCNALFFHLMHWVNTQRPDLRAGFVHIPASPGQSLDGKLPTMDSTSAAQGLVAMLTAATGPDASTATSEGSIA
ncbi:hypothetical protein [Haloglycomyces albus]|uniref:pyroglutamyl-peptidase I family protein n=1 Tax=Haloglycomyces albus TaxID=526067 RepID=UPI00046D1E04|nr:hypothetical protein [Haloglycomyces albus]